MGNEAGDDVGRRSLSRFGWSIPIGLLAVLVVLKLPNDDTSAAVPVVNMADFPEATALAKLVAAAREIGVVRLTGHGVDVGAARRAGWQYFELPVDSKGCSECSRRNASVGLQRGYIPLAAESGVASITEIKEGFSYGFEWPSDREASHPFQTSNVWPGRETLSQLGPAWRDDMMRFFNQTISVSVQVVSMLAQALGGERGRELTGFVQGGDTISQMRMFHYLPPDKNADIEKSMGSSPHTDWHFVTIISRDSASTLQIKHPKTHAWLDVAGSDDDLILLVGDWLAAYSADELHSPLHRVTSPKHRSSLSFVLFFYPAPDAVLPKGIQAERSRSRGSMEEEVNSVEDSMFELPWGEYVVQKWVKVMSNR